MPLDIQSTFDPTNSLQSTFMSPAEAAAQAQATEQARIDNMGAFGRGVNRGVYQTPALIDALKGVVTEPFAPQYSQQAYRDAAVGMQNANRFYSANDPRSFDQVRGLGDALSMIGGTAGEQIAHLPLDLIGGSIAGRALRNVAMHPLARAMTVGGAGAFPLQMGEGAMMMRDDQSIMADTTPLERLGYAGLYAGMTAPLEGMGEGLLMSRAAGGGKALKGVFSDGVGAATKDAAKHIAKAVPESMLTEGGTEAAQTAIEHALHSHLNPNRDTSRDTHDLADAFFKGWAGGLPTSVIGRGSDVAWSQSRDAVDALRGLLSSKTLPTTLKDSPDSDVLSWDKEDNDKRNGWAKNIADSIMNSETTQEWKDKASEFYDKMKGGASNAWESITQPLRESETLNRSRDNFEHFVNAAKKTYGEVSGKHNAESSDDDKIMYGQFREALDKKSHAARDTAASSDLYSTLKEALINDDVHNLPLHAMEDSFGTIGRFHSALEQMRGNLKRAGYDVRGSDEEFTDLFNKAVEQGQTGERAKMDLIKSYLQLKHGDPTEHELRQMARHLSSGFADYNSMSPEKKKLFDQGIVSAFGKKNGDKIADAFRPRQVEDSKMEDTLDVDGNHDPRMATMREHDAPANKFVGQRSASSSGENSVQGHGGFWRLDHKTDSVRDSIQKRYKRAKADLSTQGERVVELSPLEYAAKAGVSAAKVARSLNTTVDKLADHPARMLMVEPKNSTLFGTEDEAAIDTGIIDELAGKADRRVKRMRTKMLDDETADKVSNALKMKNVADQRKAMKQLGFDNGVRLENTPNGRKLHSNFDHGDNGHLTLKMVDGTERHISSQDLIAHMREKKVNGTPYQLFTAGLAALHANPDVAKVGANNLWGKFDENAFRGVGASNYFRMMPGVTLGQAHRKSFSSKASTNTIEELQAHVDKLKEQIAELEEDQANFDDIDHEAEINELSSELDDVQEELQAAMDFEAELEGDGERPGFVESKPDTRVRTHDEMTGEALHPFGRPAERGGENTDLKDFKGFKLKLRPGVSQKHFTKPMRQTVEGLRKAKEVLDSANLPTSTLDVAADYIGRAAAANRDGDTRARDAYTLMAQHRLFSAIKNEMALVEAEGSDPKTTDERKQQLRAKYAQLLNLAKDWQQAAMTYEENREEVQKHAQGYETFDRTGMAEEEAEKKGFKAATDRFSHRQEFVETLKSKTDEELIYDGKARATRLAYLESIERKSAKVEHLIKMMREELEAGRAELKARRATTTEAAVEPAAETEATAEKPKAKKQSKPRKKKVREAAEETQAQTSTSTAVVPVTQAEQAKEGEFEDGDTKEFDKLIDNLVLGAQAAKRGAEDLKAAYRTLKQALKDGELNRDELVKNLRSAMVEFKEALGKFIDAAKEGVSRLHQRVQGLIRQYQEARQKATVDGEFREATDDKSLGQHSFEGSFPTGKKMTAAEKKAVEDYIEKVLGPDVSVAFQKAMTIGGSGHWHRNPKTQKAFIKVAINATNPMSVAHHEAMHEFFQRLMDNNPKAAEILKGAANSAAVKRKIEQFFHNDPNYAKIKAQLDQDQHERVAYMFQLWVAGELKVGSETEGLFSKVVTFIKNLFGVLTNSQRAEAIMQHFHDGKMSNPSDVAAVLAKNDKAMGKYMATFGEVAGAFYSVARQALITAQNELIDSKNSKLEAIGRMFSNETGSSDKDISFLSARVMKTNQMNDRMWSIIKDADEKDIAAALNNLQTGKSSNDPKIAKIEQRIHKMLDQIHDYMIASGVKIGKQKDYFPRAWDALKIAENKQEFIDLLKKDYAAQGKGAMDQALAESIVENMIKGKGAEPLTESEFRPGYSPFMAAANKRPLDFIKSPEFAKFQQKDMVNILTTYIAGAVHRAEYTKRFGENGDKLRAMLAEAAGEAVGKEWATAKQAADNAFKVTYDTLKAQHGKDYKEIAKGLAAAGYPHGEVEVEHIARLLQGDAKKSFQDFHPQLNRAVKAIMAMEGTLGYDINPNVRKWTSGLLVYENMRLLWMSLFSQVIDPLGVAVRGGTMGDAWDTFKTGIAGTIAGWRGKPIEDSAWDLAMQLGIVDAGNFMNSQAQSYHSVYMGETAKKWNDRLFRINGVEGFSQGTRVGAMKAAINFIKFHGTIGDKHSVRYLAELGLTPADVKLVGNDLDYTDPKIQQAIFRWVDGAVLRPNAAVRPVWASDPHFALIFHMKQFTYAAQKVFLERVLNEAKHGNYDPGITMALTYVPTMIAADFLRGMISNGGEEPAWKRKWKFNDYLMEGVQRAGLLGVPQLAVDAAKWGPSELMGPLVGQVTHGVKTMSRTAAKDDALDAKAAATNNPADIAKAKEYSGTEQGLRKVFRDAMPMSEMAKRMVYDEITK